MLTARSLSKLFFQFRFQNFIPFRKVNLTRRIDDKMNVNMDEYEDDPPPVYILSRIANIGTSIEKINNNIIIEEIPTGMFSGYSDDSLDSQLQNVKILIADVDLLAINYRKMPLLKWAHCTWAGVESLFTTIAQPSFIVTRHAHQNLGIQMAEYVLAQILMCEKSYCSIRDAQRRKNWHEMTVASFEPSKHLKELTLGILGVGNMGRAIAECLKLHGASIIGLSKSPRDMSDFGFFDSITTNLHEVLFAADYIVNTLPSTPWTIGLLDGDVLQNCNKGAVFINVGRGNIVRESTLFEALRNKWLRRIVLDVFDPEPLSDDSELWNCVQATLTPHCAAMSSGENIAEDFVSNYDKFLNKLPMRSVVDWERQY